MRRARRYLTRSDFAQVSSRPSKARMTNPIMVRSVASSLSRNQEWAESVADGAGDAAAVVVLRGVLQTCVAVALNAIAPPRKSYSTGFTSQLDTRSAYARSIPCLMVPPFERLGVCLPKGSRRPPKHHCPAGTSLFQMPCFDRFVLSGSRYCFLQQWGSGTQQRRCRTVAESSLDRSVLTRGCGRRLECWRIRSKRRQRITARRMCRDLSVFVSRIS